MVATTELSQDDISRMTTPQKRKALFLLAQALLGQQAGAGPMHVPDPDGGELGVYVVGTPIFPFGPGKAIPLEEADPETQRRAKLVLAGAKTISFEEAIRGWLDPEEDDCHEVTIPTTVNKSRFTPK